MTTVKKELAHIYDLVGQTITNVGAHYDVLILGFGEYEIHVTCFARAIYDGEILLTTQDYQSWDEKDYKHNDMYLNIAKHGKLLMGQIVRNIEVSSVNDLFIVLENDARIEIYNSDGNHRLSEEREQWFFYKPKDLAYPNLSITGQNIDKWVSE